MVLKPPNRKIPVMVFDGVDDEYVEIARRVLGELNDLREREETWETVGTNINCDIQPTSTLSGNAVRQLMTGTAKLSSHIVFFPPETDVKAGDRITDYDTNEYEVDAVSNWRSHITAMTSIANKS